MRTYFFHRARAGQALIEALVAVGVLIVGFMGVVTLLNRSLGLTRVIADNFTGTYLAAEGVELIKNFIDANVAQGLPWDDGLRDGTCYEVEYLAASARDARFRRITSGTDCNLSDTGPLALLFQQLRSLVYSEESRFFEYRGIAPAASDFRRVIKITRVGTDEIQVNSVVRWLTRAGGSYSVNLEDHFFNRF